MDDDALVPLLIGAPAPIVVALLVYMVVRDVIRTHRPRRRGRHEERRASGERREL